MEKWFTEGLVKWYHLNKRDLPWRTERDPYKIWLSEVILQQTQIAQGLSYYLKFVGAYPTVKQLARAREDDVLKLWQGLGYYSRARNLHAAAKHVADVYKGRFPATYAEIRALKGVGDYTAAAVASFAFGLPHAVVDGNVYRVLSRVFGIQTPIDSGEGKRQFQKLAQDLLAVTEPGQHNQAIMEFGSQHCKPTSPNCRDCVFRTKCYAFKTDRVTTLPKKSRKTKVRERFFNYLVIADDRSRVLIKKREDRDIWQGLFEFVLIETDKAITTEQLLAKPEVKTLLGKNPAVKHVSRKYKHVLSHQLLHAGFTVLKRSEAIDTSYRKTNIKKLSAFAFPRLIEKFLDDCDLKEIL